MKIGILGSGVVGKTLALGFLKHGYNVMIGSREPGKLSDWLAGDGRGVQAGTFEQTAHFADLAVLAVKGNAAYEAIKIAVPANLSGKTVLDATNPIADVPPENSVLSFFTNINRSLMEQLQDEFPAIHFVKAFNSVGAARMVNPEYSGIKPSMFIGGNNDTAKNETREILDRFGWETEDMGGAEAARAIEPLCMLWCIPGFREKRWTHAFKLLKK
jgi:predicted dinucleotide-binding enzyme